MVDFPFWVTSIGFDDVEDVGGNVHQEHGILVDFINCEGGVITGVSCSGGHDAIEGEGSSLRKVPVQVN